MGGEKMQERCRKDAGFAEVVVQIENAVFLPWFTIA